MQKVRTSFQGQHFKAKTTKFIGELSQTDLEALSWIKPDERGGVIKTYTKEGFTVLYEIKKKTTKIIPKVVGGDISFHVKAESEGWLMEDWRAPEKERRAYMKELEQDFAKIVDQQIDQMLYKLQHTYKADVAGFGQHPNPLSKNVEEGKDNWDEVFATIPITYEIKTNIVNPGSSTE